MNKGFDALIIGCGVIGLSCGVTLLEEGMSARIVARDLPPDTASNKAGAIWFPFKASPRDLVLRWSGVAYHAFLRLAKVPESGVRMTTLFDLHGQPVPELPWWGHVLPPGQFRKMTREELPGDYVDGYAVQVPMIETNPYLDYLMDRFKALGGAIEQREVTSLDEIDWPLILNCTGLGARDLLHDTEVFPISGHIAMVKERRKVRCLLDNHGKNALSYIFPRPDVCVLGGTAVDNDWNLEPDPGIIDRIISTCTSIEPALADLELIGSYVCLRPGRSCIRFEKEQVAPGRIVFHNYGHGGSGFTVSWGCARDMARRIRET